MRISIRSSLRSRRLINKNGRAMATRLPRNKEDWIKCFPRMYRIVSREFDTPCWEWITKPGASGYAKTKLNGKPIPAHRLSWLLNVSKIPASLWVLHKCDNRICVRPDHLFLGTAMDNTMDMFKKGRNKHQKGQDHNRAKLSDGDVLKIRQMAASTDLKYGEIGKLFGVGDSAIFSIVKRDSWPHLGGVEFRSRRKLTPNDRSLIKSMASEGTSQAAIARRLNVNQSHISRILNNKERRA